MDVIFDIDGTLADVSHRLHYLKDRDWKGFFDQMHDDSTYEHIVWLAKIIDQHATILVVTARPEDYRAETEKWLADNGIVYETLRMRPLGDFRPDTVVKKEILITLQEEGYNPVMAFDDKKSVVNMYREMGLTVLECDYQETSKYAGQTLLHVMVGPSGAGKSTYIKANYKPEDVISTDEIRVQLYGNHDESQTIDLEKLKRTWAYTHDLIGARLRNGVFTVLDATNIKPNDRKNVFNVVPAGVFVQYVIIDRPLDDKLKSRGWRSESLVLKHHKTFKSLEKEALAGDNRPDVYVKDMRGKL